MDGTQPLRGVDIGLNLIVSVLVVGGVGYGVDVWLSTKPAGMLVGGFVGFGAWLWQVWKTMQNTGTNG
ncbi:MAG: AtpZ/AtpI family protein [Alphaproteobacteria bacterium]